MYLQLLLFLAGAPGQPPVAPNMRSFGSAVKESKLIQNIERTVFAYNLSSAATHGAVTQQWHLAANIP